MGRLIPQRKGEGVQIYVKEQLQLSITEFNKKMVEMRR